MGPGTLGTAGRPFRRRLPHRRAKLAGVPATTILASGLAACGSGDSGAPTLTWYINPDSGGQAEIASRCTEAAQGRYTIEVSQLRLPRAGPQELRTQAVVSIDASSRIRAGREAEFWLDSRKVHVFDPTTGDNLTRDAEAGAELTRMANQDRVEHLEEAHAEAVGAGGGLGVR